MLCVSAVRFSWRTVKTERQLEVSQRGHLPRSPGARASANPGAPMPRWADRRCLFTFVVGTPHFVGGVDLQVQAQSAATSAGVHDFSVSLHTSLNRASSAGPDCDTISTRADTGETTVASLDASIVLAKNLDHRLAFCDRMRSTTNGSSGRGSSLLSPAALTIAPTQPHHIRHVRLDGYETSHAPVQVCGVRLRCWYPHRLNRRTPRTHSTNDLSADLVTAPSTCARVGSTATSNTPTTTPSPHPGTGPRRPGRCPSQAPRASRERAEREP